MEFGRYYEEFEVGAIYKHWPGRTITEYDNTLFALLSMNQNPLFIDETLRAHATSGTAAGARYADLQPDGGHERRRHQRQNHRQSRL